jgi:hypothetical protein
MARKFAARRFARRAIGIAIAVAALTAAGIAGGVRVRVARRACEGRPAAGAEDGGGTGGEGPQAARGRHGEVTGVGADGDIVALGGVGGGEPVGWPGRPGAADGDGDRRPSVDDGDDVVRDSRGGGPGDAVVGAAGGETEMCDSPTWRLPPPTEQQVVMLSTRNPRPTVGNLLDLWFTGESCWGSVELTTWDRTTRKACACRWTGTTRAKVTSSPSADESRALVVRRPRPWRRSLGDGGHPRTATRPLTVRFRP